MIRLFLSLVFVLAWSTGISAQKNNSRLLASCCDVAGRCTGSTSCRACTNCSGCKHCSKNGGSCGVCAGSSSRSSFKSITIGSQTSKPKVRKRYSQAASSSSNFYDTSNTSLGTTFYYGDVVTVKSKNLNVRTGPEVKYDVVAQLEKGELVRCLETSSGKWIKIEAVASGVEGYVSKAFLE